MPAVGDDSVKAEARNGVYRQMIAEIDARVKPLTAERKALQSAAERIATIDVQLEVLRAEREEYDALLPKAVVDEEWEPSA